MRVHVTPSVEGDIPFYDLETETLSYRGDTPMKNMFGFNNPTK